MKKLPVLLIPALLTGVASAEAVLDETAAAGEAAVGFFDKILNGITVANSAVSGVVWGVPALVLLAFVGILMTVLTKVFQVSHFGHWFKKTIGAVFKDKHVTSHTKDKSISQFQWQQPSAPAMSWAFPAPSSPAVRVQYSGCGSSRSSA